jgi:hypothetical protein
VGLQTASTGTLSDALLAIAKHAANQFSPAERDALINLLSSERHFRQPTTKWEPFDERLLSASIDRSNHQHLLALWLALRVTRYAAKNMELEQSKKRVQATWGSRR